MNIQGVEIFLVGMALSSLCVALFLYFESRIRDFLKKADSPGVLLDKKNLKGKAVQRRRIESKPTIICSLPIHQQKRPEARLY